ncbi:MAG: OB-fold nucleic acid binding domain-containing protein, partial [Tetragenococcus koreensis]|nr:OB-fold nucleic acid binding domain-containing protein [Tetragenococcus koreensis]MDN6345139.1 OB-fold nucleic acid binding domain-containing protein [Tetragenococcus koreensis]MDN6670212.1 OB-fold nucleic acid binding domain-containing protein [Tetragenococcus koreensis]MDN6701573.1 OB-fold nucleic acid binding domain-containing protein [Tetragenococcus koreensis]
MGNRTVYCGLVAKENLEQTITLQGWVQKRRDLGGVIFIDLRDREGIVQVVFNPEVSQKAWEIADSCRSEYVLEVTGTVRQRTEEAINPNMKTGEFEVMANEITILNTAKTPPFSIEEDTKAGDEIR